MRSLLIGDVFVERGVIGAGALLSVALLERSSVEMGLSREEVFVKRVLY